MIDHVSVGVADVKRARAFYDPALAALGYARVHDVELPDRGLIACGYGRVGGPARFWIGMPERLDAKANAGGGHHFAFAAESRAAVDVFHEAALAAGATDNGGPGPRPHHHPDYYAAFVFDPDGNKLEACCRRPA